MAARGRALALAAVCAFSSLAGCGSGDGKKHTVECNSDADCDPGNLGVCDTVSCNGNRCELASLPDGHRCNDDDPLTGADSCLSGICAGVVKTCDDELDPCLKAVHDAATDECTVEPVADGASCDDGDACTQVDSCQAGACVGEQAKTCDAADDCHVAGTCDPKTGECDDVKADDGAPCDDGQACTSDDSCTDGACAGSAVVCDDGLTCSVDSCDPKSGACAADMANCSCQTDKDCNDGNACNGKETCGADDLCKAGTPVVCGSSTDACLTNVCAPETGVCEPEPVKDGTLCDDANACTGRDVCQAGACKGSSPVVCAALSQCHLPGVCDKLTGACTNPEKAKNSACNDGNACTVTDTCQAGDCVGAGQVSCAAADQCHDAGVCNAATGVCSKPAKQNGVKCDDGSPCTNGDACQNGTCTPASQTVCAASDSCHSAGTCDLKTGACSNPAKQDGTGCSDGLTCTGTDVCTGGKCAGTATKCDDGVACTVDSCSEQLGGCTTNSAACACKTSADCDDGNPCNGVETCNLQTLQCQIGKAVDCSALNDACNIGVCSAATGACAASPKASGTACDDGDKCTQASSCQAGVCLGSSPITCAASDQCHDAGACNSATGACSNPVKKNGAVCNDGNACTQADACQSGICTGANPVICAASDQCHIAGTCDTSSGLCTDPSKKNGSVCDDGSACTQTDTCQGGVCAGASPVTCTASDQCHGVGTCDAATGSCSNPVKKDGSACDDGTLCTQVDTCQAGACTGTKPVTCTASDQCHSAGACDGTTGTCSNPAKKDGSACNDNSLCTKTDSCQAGTCTGASPVTCTASDQCHDAGTCDAATGTCSNPNKTDGTLCNDGKTCTKTDKCTTGKCAGAAVTCDDGIACTVDSCAEPGGCQADQSKCGCAKDADCNDGNACNGVETCNLKTLTCVTGTAVSCSGLDDVCNVGACDTKTGACSKAPRTDGTSCDDGDACTKTDGCSAGKCIGKNSVTCTQSDQCHDVGSCDPKNGTCSNPAKTNGAACNDGNACTQTDSCQAGICSGGNPITCAAVDQCHLAGTCDKGTCSNPEKTGACDDGNKCTQSDTCLAGVCTGSPVQCSVSDQCHDIGVCNPGNGICSNPAKDDGWPCEDNDKCTKTDTCQAGKCSGSKPDPCVALDVCHTVGTCIPASGLCSNPVVGPNTSCNDGDACTSGETCDANGNCGSGSAVVCQPPSDLCKTSICNNTLGCKDGNQPTGTPCDDNSFCTQTDQCNTAGVCVGSNPLANVSGDWSDDPGGDQVGPYSVDTFTDKAGRAHIVGTYGGPIHFNDKNTTPQKSVPLPAALSIGIYWAVYGRDGTVVNALNVGGVAQGGSLTVEHAASNLDGSFTLLGTVQGEAVFGPNGKGKAVGAKNNEVYVAHYTAKGAIVWVAQFLPGGQTFAANSIAHFDDGSVIAVGSVLGTMSFRDATGAQFGTDDRTGVWAARLDADGGGQWAELAAFPGSTDFSMQVRAVTTHEDGGASLTGAFTGSGALGPKKETSVATAGGADVWFEKLDKSGQIVWGGRVGSKGADVAGDVARIEGGGALLATSLLSSAPNASDAKTTQQLHFTASSGLQTHVLVLGPDGVLRNDALIAPPGGAASTQGWQLKLDADGFYAVAGTFTNGTRFYSAVGFGAGAPKNAAAFEIASLYQGPSTLFVARLNTKPAFSWAVQAGGDNSGMTGRTGYDVVMTAQPTHAVTVAGMFDKDAYFGDKVPELLNGDPKTGSPFVVYLNSEAEYDYCP